MKTKWKINPAQSDVLLQSRHNTIGYLAGNSNTFAGYVDFDGNEVEDASVAFSMGNSLKTNRRESAKNYMQLLDLFNNDEVPVLSFESTSFQKINKNINFFKGNLTIKDVTRVVELQAEYIDSDTYNGNKKVAFEITGNINRQDFGLMNSNMSTNNGFAIGKDIQFIANFEFSI
ncbi:YceI family protein [Flavobacterium sp. TMP13]|uniref:YceI family protein n=1 Tax=unclassified Flavobacterium TaxID=196869 RepID=UPI00076D5926|nr:YceI family protein [Flavobacterium sp. TAB 87]KVV13611.1 hypothetical protein AP058_02976 [Flavobacterium sp. TAB 87]